MIWRRLFRINWGGPLTAPPRPKRSRQPRREHWWHPEVPGYDAVTLTPVTPGVVNEDGVWVFDFTNGGPS